MYNREIRHTTEICPHCQTEKTWAWLYVNGEFIPPGQIVKDCKCGKESTKRAIQMLKSLHKS